MSASAIWLMMLAVFSGLSMNLILQFGLGLKEIATMESAALPDDSGFEEKNTRGLFVGLGIFFASVILLWLLFSFIRSFLFLGLLEYILIFPVSVLLFSLLEYLISNFVIKKKEEKINFSPPPTDATPTGAPLTSGMLIGAALFITLNIAGGLAEAAVLSFGFSCGIALAAVVAGEIHRRSQMEQVPHWLRGSPLTVIALGLLSLVFSSGALMLFQVLGA